MNRDTHKMLSQLESLGISPSDAAALRLAQLVTNGCDHAGTDGTVTCPACKATASEFISAAWDYLAAHSGATATDPGYFP